MVDRVEIKCIKKTERTSPWERIEAVGGINPDGRRWRLSQSDAIAGIENGTWRFFVNRPLGDTVDVIVATSRYGNKYLKTQADGDSPNNLLSLPECP